MVSLGIAAAAGSYWYYAAWANPGGVSDFDQLWAGARALIAGEDPYQVVRARAPGPIGPFEYNLYYPLPALLAILPLAWLPIIAARAVFCAVSFGILSYLLTRRTWYPLAGLASGAGLMTLTLAQWSALTATAVLVPALSVVAATKPNAHIAVLASYPRVRSVAISLASGALLFVIAFAVRPGWVYEWLANVRGAPHFIPPIARRGGFILLLAALRWRRPEARWLLALSIVPQAPSFYDQMLLSVICLTTRESLIFAVTTVVLFFYVGFNVPQPDYAAWGNLMGSATVWFCYLPMLVMVLRRPNEGEAPAILAWLNRLRRERTA